MMMATKRSATAARAAAWSAAVMASSTRRLDDGAAPARIGAPTAAVGALRRRHLADRGRAPSLRRWEREPRRWLLADCAIERCGTPWSTGEACDDGNPVETDACLSSCRACGDGVLYIGVELVTTATSSTGRVPQHVYGRTLRRQGLGGQEACDDGNDVDTDACLTDCTAARCGGRRKGSKPTMTATKIKTLA